LEFKKKIFSTKGLMHLTNKMKGTYYGVSKDWTIEKKLTLGVVLLKKVCQIFMAEGERQIAPNGIK
jgi:hypothetical protein